MRIPPPLKGLITAALMVVVFLLVYQSYKDGSNYLQYLVYGIYGAGIIWALLAYKQSGSYTGTFGDLFQQGFKCFVVVTLCMALFYGIFNYWHPEFAEQTAAAYKEQLAKESTDKTPAEIDEAVTTFKKQYTLKLVSGAIFGYLIIGALITAVAALLLKLKKK